MTSPALAVVSHGTSSPEGQEAVSALAAAVADDARRRHYAVETRLGHVDVQRPDAAETLDSLPADRRRIVVPLLLSAGYHVHVDLRSEVDRHSEVELRRDVLLADALGPDERLVRVLVRRLHEAGLGTRSGRPDAVVMAAAGSSNANAVEDCRQTSRMLQRQIGVDVRVGFLSAAQPSLSDAVAAARQAAGPRSRVVISTYLLAPGFFHDLVLREGADVVADPLLNPGGEVPSELVDIVRDRANKAVTALSSRG